MKYSVPDQEALRREYDVSLEGRIGILRDLETALEDLVHSMPSPPGIEGRIKDFPSFFKKYLRLLKGHREDPEEIGEITDIIGIRIICPFLEDIPAVEALIKGRFEVIEVEHKGESRNFREFGYESLHLLLRIPPKMRAEWPSSGCSVAEVQIRTILQDAWAEVEHELVYKAEFTPFDEPMKRKLAAVNANLSLADIIFQEIRTYQRQLNGELGKRRDSFFRKIETDTDAFLFEVPPEDEASDEALPPPSADSGDMDDLLLRALYAHNRGHFDEAIALYSRILELKPVSHIRSIVYKHRGMAHFACSRYEEAIEDFRRALEEDPRAYKAAYYEGVVSSVLRNYPKAIAAFDRSLEINPYQPYCLYRRGQAWYHIEDYPQALADCEAALSLESSFPGAQKLRSLLQNKLKM